MFIRCHDPHDIRPKTPWWCAGVEPGLCSSLQEFPGSRTHTNILHISRASRGCTNTSVVPNLMKFIHLESLITRHHCNIHHENAIHHNIHHLKIQQHSIHHQKIIITIVAVVVIIIIVMVIAFNVIIVISNTEYSSQSISIRVFMVRDDTIINDTHPLFGNQA